MLEQGKYIGEERHGTDGAVEGLVAERWSRGPDLESGDARAASARFRPGVVEECAEDFYAEGVTRQLPERSFGTQTGLSIPSRRGPIELAGPIENHVKLARHGTFVPPNHQETLAIRREIVALEPVIIQEKVRPVK